MFSFLLCSNVVFLARSQRLQVYVHFLFDYMFTKNEQEGSNTKHCASTSYVRLLFYVYLLLFVDVFFLRTSYFAYMRALHPVHPVRPANMRPPVHILFYMLLVKQRQWPIFFYQFPAIFFFNFAYFYVILANFTHFYNISCYFCPRSESCQVFCQRKA